MEIRDLPESGGICILCWFDIVEETGCVPIDLYATGPDFAFAHPFCVRKTLLHGSGNYTPTWQHINITEEEVSGTDDPRWLEDPCETESLAAEVAHLRAHALDDLIAMLDEEMTP